MSKSELCFLPAVLLVEKIRKRDVSVLEVMEAHLARIDEVNPILSRYGRMRP